MGRLGRQGRELLGAGDERANGSGTRPRDRRHRGHGGAGDGRRAQRHAHRTRHRLALPDNRRTRRRRRADPRPPRWRARRLRPAAGRPPAPRTRGRPRLCPSRGRRLHPRRPVYARHQHRGRVRDRGRDRDPDRRRQVPPQAGVFAEGEAEVVGHRIAEEIRGRSPSATFDGKGACFVEMGDGVAAYASGDFYAHDAPAIRLRRPGKRWHKAKIAFERYWMHRWL